MHFFLWFLLLYAQKTLQTQNAKIHSFECHGCILAMQNKKTQKNIKKNYENGQNITTKKIYPILFF